MIQKIIFLENIRSLHNVGSILRTADGAGFDKVILGGYTGCPPDRRIEKVSLGAENFLDWEKREDTLACLQDLKDKGSQLIALEQTSTSINIFEKNNQFPPLDKEGGQGGDLILMVGNEVEGLTPEALKLADTTLEIPMHGQKGSLNVSVAAGIAMYQLTR